MSNLTSRIISASIGVPIIFALIIWGGTQGIAILGLLVTIVLAYELSRMGKAGNLNGNLIFVLVLVFPLASIVNSLFQGIERIITFCIAAFIVLFVIAIKRLFFRDNLRLFFVFITAIFVYGLSLAHVPEFTKIPNGANWVILILITSFSIDTCGYFIGSKFGKRLLLPRVSPKKTWEGLGASIIGGVIAFIMVSYFLNLGIGLWVSMVTGGIMGFLAVGGDLYASSLKRIVKFKDSSVLIPGHGGILDRFDSIAPNLVFIYWIAHWSGV